MHMRIVEFSKTMMMMVFQHSVQTLSSAALILQSFEHAFVAAIVTNNGTGNQWTTIE